MGMKLLSRRGVEPPSVKEATSPSGEQVELALRRPEGGRRRCRRWSARLLARRCAGARRLRGRRALQLRPRPNPRAVAEPDPGRLVRVRGPCLPARARRARAAERHPRPRPLGAVDGRGAGGRSRRARAPPLPEPGLSVHARPPRRVLARRRRASPCWCRRRTRDPTPARTGSARIPTSPPGTGSWTSWSSAFRRAPHSSPISARSPSTGSRWKGPSSTSGCRKPIGSVQLDHCFTDLERDGDGRARVELGGRAALWVDESYPYVMVFTGDALPDVSRRSRRRRADDVRAERIPQRQRPDPARARSDAFGQLGHRSPALGGPLSVWQGFGG